MQQRVSMVSGIGVDDCQQGDGDTEQCKGLQSNAEITLDIINSMEQGILVWSASGHCLMHNNRIFEVLELRSDDIFIGRARSEFFELAIKRGEINTETARGMIEKFQRREVFEVDRLLPSGRVVTTNARPMATGGFVVTYTDVTKARRNESELDDAKQVAEAAEVAAKQALKAQQIRQVEASLLSELDEWLQSCKSLDELYRIVSAFMVKLLPGSSGELYIYSNSRDVLDGACYWGDGGTLEHIQPDACWALRRGRAYENGAGTISFPCTHVEEQGSLDPEQRFLCVPIVAHGDTVGLLHIKFAPENDGNCVEPSIGLGTGSHQFAVQCAEHISLAIANVKLRDELRDQSIRDSLTGLFNRRYFVEAMRSELSRAERKGTQVGLISFDADKFKMFNDNHGHDAGDMVLRAIGEAARVQFCNGETICRYGGEEFCILLPESSAEAALEAAEQLRQTIEGMKIRYGDGELPRVTISAGVAVYPASGRLPQDLLKAADSALYEAKGAGRNSVVAAHSRRR